MDILNFNDWKTVTCEETEFGFLAQAISLSPALAACPRCRIICRQRRHGTRRKIVSDFPLRGKPLRIEFQVPRYRCARCRTAYSLRVKGLESQMSVTMRLADFIFSEYAIKTCAQISRETGVRISTIREVHVRRMERNEKRLRFTTPQVLGIDGVYVNRRDRCVLTDISKRRVVGLYESTTQLNVVKYLLDLTNREKVKAVTMDMALSFRNAVRKALPQAVIVIDKYHVQRLAKKAMDRFLSALRSRQCGNSKSATDKFDYVRDRFLLYRHRYNLTEAQRQQMNLWANDVPSLKTVYELKEGFYNIWQYTARSAAEAAFDDWRNSIPPELKFIFKEILSAFKNWRAEIFNYFDYRVTNAFTESANRKIKMIQKSTSGCSFWVVRAKILWQEYRKLSETEHLPPLVTHDCRYVLPRKGQYLLRLRQSYERHSKIFALMFPGNGWRERFEPYVPLLTRTR